MNRAPPLVQVREHRGSLDESMQTVFEICDLADLDREIARRIGVANPHVSIKPYGRDPRTGWDTHIITVTGYGVFGFKQRPGAGR